MNRKTDIIYGILLVWLLCSCHREMKDFTGGNAQSGIPVRFTAECPQDNADTRALTDKTAFQTRDVMHVSACFTLEDGTTVTQYATLTLQEDGEWVNKTYLPMNWPWNATGASFTAYYMKEWNGPISTPGNSTAPVLLDRFEYNNESFNPDPLKAEATVSNYGEAVHLRFNHLCTRLTIQDVDPADEYWLKYKTYPGIDPSALKNACRLTRNEDNTLAFDFVEEESGKVSAQVSDYGEGDKAVTFHLAPGDYSTFALTQRNGYAYLTLAGVNKLSALEAGHSYIVSLKDLQGNIVPDDDKWPDPGNPDPEVPEYEDFNIDAFLQAIYKCEGYTCKLKDGTPITLLKKDAYRNEVLLTENVDFGGKTFTAVDLPNQNTFDGGNHSIKGVAQPIFNTLYGTVKYLNIYSVSETISVSDDGSGAWGILARTCTGGNISNIRLGGTSVEYTVPDGGAASDKVYNVGSLIGLVSSGSVSDIMVAGNVYVTVQSDYNRVYTVCAGGVVGQSGGSIVNIDNLAERNTAIHVTNTCKGLSSRYTGGVVGLLSATMDGCEVNTVVDAAEAIGTWNYAGGVVGAVRNVNDSSTGAAIQRVTVSGSVRGGVFDLNSEITSERHSSTGGVAGHVQKASVMETLTFNSVSVRNDLDINIPSGTDVRVYVTIGGVFGSMQNAGTIRDNEGRGGFNATGYDKNRYYAGTFCGAGGDSEILKADGNTANGEGGFMGYDDHGNTKRKSL